VPPAALPVLLPPALGLELLLPLALGVELLLPAALGVELLPLEEEPELCASVTLDNAKSAAAVAALMSFRVMCVLPPYCFFSVLEGAPLLEPAPLAPEGGMPLPLGLVVLPLPDGEALGVLGVVPPAAAPDFLLKYSSHSERDTCPSLFLSTAEKLGASFAAPVAPALGEALEPLAALPLLGEALEPLEAPPLLGDALGVELELEPPEALLPEALLLPVAPALEPDLSLLAPELCASETLASAKSAAAVAVLMTFNNI
jgi:hypothetical protein